MSKSPPAKATNPYLDTRREWNERYGDYISQAKNWRAACFGLLAITSLSVAGNVIQGVQSKIKPYLIQVDKHQIVMPIGPAEAAGKADPRIVTAQLAGFIGDIRSVYLDAGAGQAAVHRAYALVDANGAAYPVVNEYMRANDPFKRAQTESVSIQINSVLKEGGDTWRIEWTETVRDRVGEVKSTTPWQASITVNINPPTDQATVLTNPLGVYVTALSWSARTQ